MAKIIIDGFKIAHTLMEAITEYVYENRYKIEDTLGYDEMNNAIHSTEHLAHIFKQMEEKKQ